MRAWAPIGPGTLGKREGGGLGFRSDAGRRALPLLPAVVSSNDDREMVLKCLTLGAIDYLVKPLRQTELHNLWTRVWWFRQVRSQLLSLPFSSPAQSPPSDCSSSPGSFNAHAGWRAEGRRGGGLALRFSAE